VMKEENPAQHILQTPVSHKFRMAPRVPHRNTEMVVAATGIIGDPRLRPGKHKNPRFTVVTNFFSIMSAATAGHKSPPRIGYPPWHGIVSQYRRVEQVHRGMLIASHNET